MRDALHESLEDAVERTIASLDCGNGEAALVAAIRAVALAVTAAPDNASLVRELRCLLIELRAQVMERADEDSFDTLLTQFTDRGA